MSKVWLITGSGNGLGRDIAEAALAAGLGAAQDCSHPNLPYLVAIEPFRWVPYPAMLRRIRRAWFVAYTGMSRIDTA
jgi:hypothetical protein